MSDDDLADLGLDDVDLLDIDGAGDLLDELDDLGLGPWFEEAYT